MKTNYIIIPIVLCGIVVAYASIIGVALGAEEIFNPASVLYFPGVVIQLVANEGNGIICVDACGPCSAYGAKYIMRDGKCILPENASQKETGVVTLDKPSSIKNPPAKPKIIDRENDTSIPTLSQAEKEDALIILQNDPSAASLLKQRQWNAMVGLWQKPDISKGAAILVKFEEPQWIHGSFHDANLDSYMEVSQWVGSMHAYVDLDENKLKGMTPGGISRPPSDFAISAMIPEALKDKLHEDLDKDTLDRIKQISIQYASKNHGIEKPYSVIFNGYQKNDAHPDGVAFVTVFGDIDESKKTMIGIDVSRMNVIEKYSGEIVDLSGNQ